MSTALLASPRPDAPAAATCLHCGNTFQPVEGRAGYCCTGCEYVHRLITGQNLDRFYALRRGASAPVRPVVFQPRDLRWLEGLVKRAEERAVGDEASQKPQTRIAGAIASFVFDISA